MDAIPPATNPTGTISSDLIGQGDSATYGADIGPSGGQNMWAFDPIAGMFPPQERNSSPAVFTGGDGLGGLAEPFPPQGITPDSTSVPGTVYQRRGF